MSYTLKPRDYKHKFVESYVAELVRAVNCGELAPRDLCRHLRAVRVVEKVGNQKRPSQVENLLAELAQLLTARKLSENAYYLLRRILLPEVLKTRATTYLTESEGEILREYIVGDLPKLEVYGELREAGFGLKYEQERPAEEVVDEADSPANRSCISQLPYMEKYYDILLEANQSGACNVGVLQRQTSLVAHILVEEKERPRRILKLYHELDDMALRYEITAEVKKALKNALRPEVIKINKSKRLQRASEAKVTTPVGDDA